MLHVQLAKLVFNRPHLYNFFRRRFLSFDFIYIVSHSAIASLYFACTSETANVLCDVYFSHVRRLFVLSTACRSLTNVGTACHRLWILE
jgi:hypothetical protein